MQLTKSFAIQIPYLLFEVQWANFGLICKLRANDKHVFRTYIFVFITKTSCLVTCWKKQRCHFKTFGEMFCLQLVFKMTQICPKPWKPKRFFKKYIWHKKKRRIKKAPFLVAKRSKSSSVRMWKNKCYLLPKAVKLINPEMRITYSKFIRKS